MQKEKPINTFVSVHISKRKKKNSPICDNMTKPGGYGPKQNNPGTERQI